MVDELSAIKELHAQQRRWRKKCFIGFISTVLVSSVVFILFTTMLHNYILQLVTVISMFAIFGLIFLDWFSFQINKKYFPKEMMHDYVLEHSNPEDIHNDAQLSLSLVHDRRQKSQRLKKNKDQMS